MANHPDHKARQKLVAHMAILGFAATALLPLQAGAAAKISPAGKGLYVSDYASSGDWSVKRYTKDAKGTKLSHCEASAGFEGDRLLLLRFDSAKLVVAFSGGYGFETPAKPTDVAMSFDGKSSESVSVKVKPMTTSEGLTLSSFSQLTSDGPGHEDALMNSKTVDFSYKNSNGEQSVSYDLSGSNKALKALFACVNG